jgi:hypothetical protein
VNSTNTLDVYRTLFRLFHPSAWRDIRHYQTLLWMVVGILLSKSISLNAWADFTHSRGKQASSRVRRFSRWFKNPRIVVDELYGPIIGTALASWGEARLYLALDTSMLPDGYCQLRLSVIYRGRAVPLVWQVIAHKSSSVKFKTYQPLLDKAVALLPAGVAVVLLADRGFVDTQLMRYLQNKLMWHYRIRVKANIHFFVKGQRLTASQLKSARGSPLFYWGEAELQALRAGDAGGRESA